MNITMNQPHIFKSSFTIILAGTLTAISVLGIPNPAAASNTNAEPTHFRAPGKITTVTVHRGWASVVRRVEVLMDSPEVALNLTDLPAATIHDSVQAEILGDAADAVTVREVQVVNAPTSKPQTDLRILLTLNGPQTETDANPFLDSTIIVNVNYIVTNVDWVPTYTIRAESESSTVRITCDLVIGQTTGENWQDVLLTFSNAPGRVLRWGSIFRAKRMGIADDSNLSQNSRNKPTAEQNLHQLETLLVDLLGGDASVFASASETTIFDWSNSPIVEETLPYRVSVPSGTLADHTLNPPEPNSGLAASFPINNPIPLSQSRRIRFRLDEFTLRPPFRYIAVPAASQDAFLVGTIRNTRASHLLPGCVSLFLDSEYAGEMILPDLAPGQLLDIAFGTAPDLLIHRREISRSKRKTGLLGDGRETQITYQISIQNSTGRPANVEVWDQIPVADTGDISLSVDKLSHPLSKDQKYLQNQRSRGLLRWDLAVPYAPRPNAPLIVNYTLVISHHRDVTPAWIPE